MATTGTGVYTRTESSLRTFMKFLIVESRIELSAFKTVSKTHITIKVGPVTEGSAACTPYAPSNDLDESTSPINDNNPRPRFEIRDLA